MKRFEKYQTLLTCGSTPQRISIILGDREVAEIYARDGEMEVRGPNYDRDHSDVIWREDIKGWGSLDVSEHDHYIHEAIRRIDPIADPTSLHGMLDEIEPVPEIGPGDPQPGF
ncbi:hypothetical protein [Pseudosulfitobacter pseudonitzschiae]|uniref:hypothetical protein n=1 Tax=Pseudosulfitobacter pseudonitzschiae TaxID=1402135 RepID=UPI003B80232C